MEIPIERYEKKTIKTDLMFTEELSGATFYLNTNTNPAYNNALPKYGRDVVAMNINSLTIICSGLTSIGEHWFVIWIFFFQFSISAQQILAMNSRTSAMQTVGRDVGHFSKLINNCLDRLWLGLLK